MINENMNIEDGIKTAKEINSRKFNSLIHCIHCNTYNAKIEEWLTELLQYKEWYEYIQNYYKEVDEKSKERMADGNYHQTSILDGESFALKNILEKFDKIKENK